MFRIEFPMVYEIIFDQIPDRNSENAYGRNFENNILRKDIPGYKRLFLRIEKALYELDPDSKKVLSDKIWKHKYPIKRHLGRGWHQLFDILNEARAYSYLKSLGCSDTCLIPESRKKTPDLEGVFPSCKVLCEVKTINISDEEAKIRASDKYIARTTQDQLEEGFFRKLESDITNAKEKFESYDSTRGSQLIIYIFIIFDESPFCEYKERYFQQIDHYLSENIFTGINLVFHNLETGFHKPITMKFATVVND
jgi:hypothetical protein